MKLIHEATPDQVPDVLSETDALALLADRWADADPLRFDDQMRPYYGAKYRVAAGAQPERILEIGVRAGYSGLMFLAACPTATYVGLDWSPGGWGGDATMWAHAPRVLDGYRVTLYEGNSQNIASLDDQFDLVHVDADHSLEGAWHDINLAATAGGEWILVDDYDLIATVRAAADHFLVRNAATWAGQYIGDANFRGQLLLRRRGTG